MRLRGDEEVASQMVALSGNTATDVELRGTFAPGGYVVQIDDPTGLAGDDQRAFVLGDAAPLRVRVLLGEPTDEPSAYFLERAFGALGSDQAPGFAVSAVTGVDALQGTTPASADLTVWTAAIDRVCAGLMTTSASKMAKPSSAHA